MVYTDEESGFVWRPRNYGRSFYGPITLREALSRSVNNATVHLFNDVGVGYVIDYARRLGIDPPSSAYQPILRTASGQGYGAVVRIDRLAVDGREIGGIEAVVVRDLSVNLLGQSALKRLGKVTLEGDRLVISAS